MTADHRIYGKRYFKMSFYIFSVFKAKDDEWWLYARHEVNQNVYFLGKIKPNGVNELTHYEYEWAVSKGRDKLFEIAGSQFDTFYKMNHIMDGLENHPQSVPNQPVDRGKRISDLVEEGYSFSEIAVFLKRSKSTVYALYQRYKKNRLHNSVYFGKLPKCKIENHY